MTKTFRFDSEANLNTPGECSHGAMGALSAGRALAETLLSLAPRQARPKVVRADSDSEPGTPGVQALGLPGPPGRESDGPEATVTGGHGREE
jgi:hypothetical protein